MAHDAQPWDAYAARFQKDQGLLLNPLLSLMAWRLAKLAAANPRINATVGATMSPEPLYDRVNLGFMVQADGSLYLVVRCGVQKKLNSSRS